MRLKWIKKIKQCKTFIHNVVQPGLWIRSHFLRIRSVSDPAVSINADPEQAAF